MPRVILGARPVTRDQDWSALALEVRRKKFGEIEPVDLKDKARQMRFLQYRGFESDQVRAALDAD